MKKIAIVFNGGTISMKIDSRIKAAVPSLTGEEIMSMVTGIEEYANIESYSFSSLPSPHITPDIMIQLKEFIEDLLSREDIDGVVVTHGTDTLEETAYFLHLTINSTKPIVITGAMRSSSELGYDGPSNLAAAICTAISEESINRGVIVCFNGELNSAAEVTKANSMALNAFTTPNFGPIGIVDNNKVIYYRNIPRENVINIDKVDGNVALMKCVAGMSSDFIDFALEKGYKGIVIEAMGRGNVPPSIVESIKKAIENKVAIVLVSRCFEGRVFESYGYNGGGKMLKNLGVIFADTMPGQKARMKLMVCISKGMTLEEINKEFEF